MGTLKVNETPKEAQSKALSVLKENASIEISRGFAFIESYFDSDDESRRKDAHKIWSKLLDKAVPNISMVQHDHTGSIDEAFAKKLRELADRKNVKEVEIREIKDTEEPENATERIFATTDAKGIYNSLRKHLESK